MKRIFCSVVSVSILLLLIASGDSVAFSDFDRSDFDREDNPATYRFFAGKMELDEWDDYFDPIVFGFSYIKPTQSSPNINSVVEFSYFTDSVDDYFIGNAVSNDITGYTASFGWHFLVPISDNFVQYSEIGADYYYLKIEESTTLYSNSVSDSTFGFHVKIGFDFFPGESLGIGISAKQFFGSDFVFDDSEEEYKSDYTQGVLSLIWRM